MAGLEIARTPTRVTDLLLPRRAEVRELVAAGGWLFVSGNAAMGEHVDAMVADALGDRRYRECYEAMRYIVST